ncbi:MAG: AMP-binding protein [Gammaproteobacteria bacterium]|nr:AMP-binding protein [Gammaproteobacteria bacterium]
MDTITQLLRTQAHARPDDPALIYADQPMTYLELERLANKLAGGLHRLGVRGGDRVALWLPNTPAYIALNLACARLGAIAVAVNTRFRSVEVGDIVGRSGAKVMAMWPGFRSIDFLEILTQIDPHQLAALETIVLYDEGTATNVTPRAIEHCQRLRFDELASGQPHATDAATPNAGCNIFTTSGTTKAPKFVLHDQASVTRHARVMAHELGLNASRGAVLQAIPLCGVFGFCQATAALSAGRPMIMMNAFEPERAVQLMEKYGVTHFNGTDDMIDPMLDASPHEIAFPNVAYAGFASFAASPDIIIDKAERRGLTLAGLYGMSEVQAFFARQPLEAARERRQLGGGVPLGPEAAVRVRNPDTGELLGVGESGELELCGPSLMREYFENEEATAETLTDDGYLKSGDLGYLTDDGGFVFQTRIGDVLRLGGFLVSPMEIESHLNLDPRITGAQVVAVATERGPRPVAFVTLQAGAALDESALREHCMSGLAKYKTPVRIFALEEFPTTKSANATKIQRNKLREMAEESLRSDG